ncbi:MAG: helix-turn-helix domain-containing protein [Burkholderiaceae bacterium]
MQKKLRQVDSKFSAQPATVVKKASTNEPLQRRFSPTRLAAHRAKTGVSAMTYGKLLGIGGQTSYNWEQGEARPSAQQIQQLAEVRELSRRALLDRLGVSAAS